MELGGASCELLGALRGVARAPCEGKSDLEALRAGRGARFAHNVHSVECGRVDRTWEEHAGRYAAVDDGPDESVTCIRRVQRRTCDGRNASTCSGHGL